MCNEFIKDNVYTDQKGLEYTFIKEENRKGNIQV